MPKYKLGAGEAMRYWGPHDQQTTGGSVRTYQSLTCGLQTCQRKEEWPLLQAQRDRSSPEVPRSCWCASPWTARHPHTSDAPQGVYKQSRPCHSSGTILRAESAEDGIQEKLECNMMYNNQGRVLSSCRMRIEHASVRSIKL